MISVKTNKNEDNISYEAISRSQYKTCRTIATSDIKH